MKISFKMLLVLTAFGALATTACSQKKTEDATTTTAPAVSAPGASVDNTVDNAKADLAREPGDTAVVRSQPADKVVEKVPAKK